MAIKVPADTEDSFISLMATQTAELVLPTMQEMIRQRVQAELPSAGMNQGELAERLGYGVKNPEFIRLAYQVLPRYGAGKSTRWDRHAVDKFLEDYSE